MGRSFKELEKSDMREFLEGNEREVQCGPLLSDN